MIAATTAEVVGGVEEAERRILRAILDGRWAFSTLAALRRAGRVEGCRGAAGRALGLLVRDGWIVTFQARPRSIRAATLTPWGAEQLDVALIQPADDAEIEPRWGIAGIREGGPYDEPPEGRATGLYADEPDHFTIDVEWPEMDAAGIRRSMTRFEKIARARDVAKRKPPCQLVIDEYSGEPLRILGQVVPRDPRIKPGRATA